MACASLAAGALCAASVASPSIMFSSRSCAVSGSPLSLTSLAPLRTRVLKKSSTVVAMASPIKPKQLLDDLVDKIKESISTAQEVCFGNEDSDECVVAWDEVEELSAAAAHKRQNNAASGGGATRGDPLEQYCEDNPETDECRVYED